MHFRHSILAFTLLLFLSVSVNAQSKYSTETKKSKYGTVSQSKYGSTEQKKSKYGSSSIQRKTYGKVDRSLEAHLYITNEQGNYCIEVDKNYSYYIKAICIDKIDAKITASKLLGEPILNVTASYDFDDCPKFRKGNWESNGCLAFGFNEALREDYAFAYRNLKLIDFDISALVTDREKRGQASKKWGGKQSADPLYKGRYGNDEKAHFVTLDTGLPGAQGEYSLNLAGSPSWEKVLNPVRNTNGTFLNWPSGTDNCDLSSTVSDYGARISSTPSTSNSLADQAKSYFDKGPVFHSPGVCKADLSSLVALNDAIQNLCAFLVANNSSTGGTPCKGNETATFGSNIIASNLDNLFETGLQKLDFEGTLSKRVLGKNVNVSVQTPTGSKRLNANTNGAFSIPLELFEGKNRVSVSMTVDGIPFTKNYSIKYDPTLIAYPVTRFESSNGLYGYRDATNKEIFSPKFSSASESLEPFGCVKYESESSYRLISADKSTELTGYGRCEVKSINNTGYAALRSSSKVDSKNYKIELYKNAGKNTLLTSTIGTSARFDENGITVFKDLNNTKTESYTYTDRISRCKGRVRVFEKVKKTGYRNFYQVNVTTYNFNGKVVQSENKWQQEADGPSLLRLYAECK